MGIESTIEMGRQEAINLCAERLGKALANLKEKPNEEIENLLYAVRPSIFENYMITGE